MKHMLKHIITFGTLCGITIPLGKVVGLAIAPWFM